MSTIVFPVLKSSNWKMSRAPQWSTQVVTAVSGDRKRAPLQEKSLWKWTLKNGILQTALGDLQAIQGLFNQMQGRWDYFLWLDPEGASIADPSQQINILGNSYWPVAFTHDSTDFDRFAYQLWECGTLEFEQVGIPSGTLSNLQLPNGDLQGAGVSASATLNIKTANVAGTGGFTGITDVSSGPHSSAISFGTSSLSATGPYAARTDSVGLPDATVASIQSMEVWVRNFGTLLATLASPAQVLVYDLSVTVTFQNGTTGAFRPTSASTNNTDVAYGSILNPGNAIDSDASTFATISRTHYAPLADYDVDTLILSGFTQV